MKFPSNTYRSQLVKPVKNFSNETFKISNNDLASLGKLSMEKLNMFDDVQHKTQPSMPDEVKMKHKIRINSEDSHKEFDSKSSNFEDDESTAL